MKDTIKTNGTPATLEVGGGGLTIEDVVRVARNEVQVAITQDPEVLGRMERSHAAIQAHVGREVPLYGVTTGFGGMAGRSISECDMEDLQRNALRFHKCGVGSPLPDEGVRAAILARMNSHLKGVSGVRVALVERLEEILNLGITPLVPENGSIGASGDLVPLTYVTGAAIGFDEAYRVRFQGREMSAPEALAQCGLEKIALGPKDALSMINGNSFSAGLAALCIHDFETIFSTGLCIDVLVLQALRASNQPFHPFIHATKSHAGQRWVAARTLEMLSGSEMIRDEYHGWREHRDHGPIQDRYAQRCLPQYLGPFVDGFLRTRTDFEAELNGVSDNPLVDPDSGITFHGGNFLGQYLGMGLDSLRKWLGMIGKHLDVQTAQLMSPEFSYGLPACLVGNPGRAANMGMKGLQLTSNSLVPLLTFYGNSIVDRFPTHAEQFNQNVNSQSFNAACLTINQIEIARRMIAVSFIAAIQALDLRSHELSGHYDARETLSPASARLYEVLRETLGVPPSRTRPYVFDDEDHWLDEQLTLLVDDIGRGGAVVQVVHDLVGPVGRGDG